MKVIWAPDALADYRKWQRQELKIAQKIERLIADIKRDPFTGIGKPEALRQNMAGLWSRRIITGEHRLVYRISGARNEQRVEILQCRFHYR